MATNYVELIAKLQQQTLEGIKQMQNLQLATLHTVREMVTSLPTTMTTSVPTVEGVPSVSQIAELNTQFATQLLDQQKAYANQIAEVFAPVSVTTKTSVN